MREEDGILVSPNGRNAPHAFFFQSVATPQLTIIHYSLAEATGAGDESSRFLETLRAPIHNSVGLIAYIAGPLACGTEHNALRSASDAGLHCFTGL